MRLPALFPRISQKIRSFWVELIQKHGSWWVGSVVGDFRYSFVCDPDYSDFPISRRIRAATGAAIAACHEKLFWSALGLTIILMVALSSLDTLLHISDANGTLGAVFGFLLGYPALGYAIYRGGIKTYREQLLGSVQGD
jgi:hypothetical protein